MITVVIVDDHPVVRAGMRTILAAATDITILAEEASGADALRLVTQHKPDVLVLDVNLPDMNGLDVVQKLCQQGTATAVLILTAYDDHQAIFGLLECGAIGYVLKDEAVETLVDAVRAAARGESWLSPSVASQVVQRALENPQPSPEPSPITDEVSALTPRETEVLRLLAQGLDNAAIAQQLVVTKRTVQNHVSNIYGKLGMDTRIEAALYAINQGLVQVPSARNERDSP